MGAKEPIDNLQDGDPATNKSERPTYSPLSDRPGPHFPVFTSISQHDVEFIYQASFGVYGLSRILNRNNLFKEEAEDFAEEKRLPLHPCDESYLWSALTALSQKLAEHMEDLYEKTIDTKGE